MRHTRLLFLSHSNPWLAGKPLLSMANPAFGAGKPSFSMARPLFSVTKPLHFAATPQALFRRTPVQRDMIISPFFVPGLFMPIWVHVFHAGQWVIGHSYNAIPWVLLLYLVMFLIIYGCRIHDYDRGYMMNTNFQYKDMNMYMHSLLSHDLYTWRYLSDTWLAKVPEDCDGKLWTVAKDGSAEPSRDLVSPGGLAAYHCVSGTSLKWELIVFVSDWNDSWVRRSHLLLVQPSWIIGGTQNVHNKPRSYVGDWTEEYFPWCRSSIFTNAVWPTGIDN